MAAKGAILEKPITTEYILSITNGGWDIFVKEIGYFPVGRAFKHPLKRDRDPSGSIFNCEGVWLLFDWASTFPTMNALQFVAAKYGIDWREARKKVCADLGIEKMDKEYVPLEVFRKPPEYGVNDIHVSFTEGKWRKEHHEFWENTDVTKAHCLKYDTFAVKEAAINRRKVKIKPNEVVWAYYAADIDRVKLYFPERPKKERFRGNVPNDYIWNINNVGECDKLVVQKSMKDLLCTTVLFECVIATQNESAKIFTNALADRVNVLSKNIWLAFGSDPQGVQQSKEISDFYKYKWVNPPKNLLPEINDAYSLEKAFGVEAWKECLIKKGIL